MTYNTLINTDTLLQNINKPNWVIIDCRFALGDSNAGRKAYQSGHIPNASYAHLNEDLSSQIIPKKTGRHPLPDINTFVDQLGKWGIHSGVQVIVYDDKGGAIAARLWWLLNWLGHSNVAVLNGGWQMWIKKNHPISKQAPKITPKSFSPTLQAQLTISKKEIAIQTEDSPSVIVDSRAHERYLGRMEPIDPIAGHIPGAISLPFADNLDTNGQFLSKELLQKRFSAISKLPKPPVFYCGSGVTACHNILAYKHAGYGDAILYPGSWSEWIVGY